MQRGLRRMMRFLWSVEGAQMLRISLQTSTMTFSSKPSSSLENDIIHARVHNYQCPNQSPNYLHMDRTPTLALFTQALQFASRKHSTQRRKTGDTPYINHPIEVANILAQAQVEDLNVLCAAILHDTIEDTDTSKEELEAEFGSKITQIVLECSDDKSLSSSERKRHQIEHSLEVSTEAKLVKIADKLSNNRDLLKLVPPNWSAERVSGYHLWSYAVCNNLYGVNAILDQQMNELFTKTGSKGLEPEEMNRRLEEYYTTL